MRLLRLYLIPQEKATAVNMLSCYAEELKDGFWEYVPAVLKLVINGAEGQSPLIKFYLNEEVGAGVGTGRKQLRRVRLITVRWRTEFHWCVARYRCLSQCGGKGGGHSGLQGCNTHLTILRRRAQTTAYCGFAHHSVCPTGQYP